MKNRAYWRNSTLGLLFAVLACLLPSSSSALAVLTGTWTCNAYALCNFQVTSNNHPAYQWNFGDGNFSGVQSSRTTSHTYSIPTGPTEKHFTVYVIAYGSTTPGTSPDNIIACTITTYNAGVGGDPTTFSGSCS